VQAKRRHIWERYADALASWAPSLGVTLPCIPPDREQSFHMFYVLTPSGPFRDALFAHLKARSMLAVSHYIPLHLSQMGLRFGGRAGDCPVAERVGDLLVRLPFYTNMTGAEQDEVIEALGEFRA